MSSKKASEPAVPSSKGVSKKPNDPLPARRKHRLFIFHYSPGKKLFQTVVRLSDAPGSYRSVLDLLSDKVNLIGTSTYSLEDGTAIFNGISEALSAGTTPESLKRMILSSKAALDAQVWEDKDGLLVDSFHSGPEVKGEAYMLFRRSGEQRMFDKVVEMLGSGGEALIFHEAMELGRESAVSMVDLIGKDLASKRMGYLADFITGRGWGTVEILPSKDYKVASIRVKDCFECTGEAGHRQECSFFRGFFTGMASAVAGNDVTVKEVRCGLKGADVCEFKVSPAK